MFPVASPTPDLWLGALRSGEGSTPPDRSARPLCETLRPLPPAAPHREPECLTVSGLALRTTPPGRPGREIHAGRGDFSLTHPNKRTAAGKQLKQNQKNERAPASARSPLSSGSVRTAEAAGIRRRGASPGSCRPGGAIARPGGPAHRRHRPPETPPRPFQTPPAAHRRCAS